MLPAPIFHGLLLDSFSLALYLLHSAEIHISRCHVIQGFMVSLVVVVSDETPDGLLQFPREVEVLQLDHILKRGVTLSSAANWERRTNNSTQI